MADGLLLRAATAAVHDHREVEFLELVDGGVLRGIHRTLGLRPSAPDRAGALVSLVAAIASERRDDVANAARSLSGAAGLWLGVEFDGLDPLTPGRGPHIVRAAAAEHVEGPGPGEGAELLTLAELLKHLYSGSEASLDDDPATVATRFLLAPESDSRADAGDPVPTGVFCVRRRKTEPGAVPTLARDPRGPITRPQPDLEAAVRRAWATVAVADRRLLNYDVRWRIARNVAGHTFLPNEEVDGPSVGLAAARAFALSAAEGKSDSSDVLYTGDISVHGRTRSISMMRPIAAGSGEGPTIYELKLKPVRSLDRTIVVPADDLPFVDTLLDGHRAKPYGVENVADLADPSARPDTSGRWKAAAVILLMALVGTIFGWPEQPAPTLPVVRESEAEASRLRVADVELVAGRPSPLEDVAVVGELLGVGQRGDGPGRVARLLGRRRACGVAVPGRRDQANRGYGRSRVRWRQRSGRQRPALESEGHRGRS